MQRTHRCECRIAHGQPCLHEVAEFQQPHAEPIAAGVRAIHETARHHVIENAVCRGRMQAGGQRQLLETDGVRVLGERIQQRHHAFDDLDGGLAG
ncbi:hypothetical protein D3C86_1765190 [compost metagenome]